MRSSRRLLVIALAIGIGLLAAPALFQMFTRAPLGGQMIDEFDPFMDASVLADFDAHLDTIDAAHGELTRVALPAVDDPGSYPQTHAMADDWPAIETSMRGMLADIEANVDNFRAVAALPPFPLFPWFFVLPGAITIGVAAIGLRRAGTGRPPAAAGIAVAVLGVGLVAAPAAFQMFSRAPAGGEMLDELRPLMTQEKVQEMQASFLTLGGMEGELRNRLLPALERRPDAPAATPALHEFVGAWPTIGSDMAPMIGAMADNLDNYAAVDALPPFPLFPWFFVIPGLLLAGLGLGSRHAAGRISAVPTPVTEHVIA